MTCAPAAAISSGIHALEGRYVLQRGETNTKQNCEFLKESPLQVNGIGTALEIVKWRREDARRFFLRQAAHVAEVD